MKAIILAAGKETRLGKYTKDLPKGMLNFIGKTLIERQVEILNECGIKEIIVTGYMANKIQIKQAIESLYEVEVAAVNTMNYGGKAKSRSTKSGYIPGRTQAFKKAIVTLAEGQSIDFYSNI